MMRNKQKKSLGFLSVVAFLMILVGVGYTVSSVVATSTNTTSTSILPSSEPQPQPLQDSLFSSLEKQVATTAESLRNNLLGTLQIGTSSGTEQKQQATEWDGQPSPSAAAMISLADPLPLPQVYGDISNSAYVDAILILYSHWILQGGKQFYPTNYVRISDFIRVVMDAYRLKLWYNLESLEGLTKNEYYSFTTVPIEVLTRINSAYEWWFLTKLALEDADGNSRLDSFISPTEAQDILFAIQKKSPELVKYPTQMQFTSDETLNKAEMAQLIVSAFWIQLNEYALPVFSDISWTAHQADIQKLAKLWIVAWVNGKFYPDAKVENKDFVIMLVRTLVYTQGKPIVIDNFYYINPLHNVSTTATYAPYLEYCLELKICTPLLTQVSWGVGFQADRLLSRSEIIPIVSAAAQIKFDLPNARRWEYLTRGELASLFVYMFQLSEREITPNENSIENSSTGALSSSSTEEKAGSKSRRETFQDLMKIQ